MVTSGSHSEHGAEKAHPGEEWIVGINPWGEGDFVVHRTAPRFIAEYMICDVDGEEASAVAEYVSNNIAFYNVDWIDSPPEAADEALFLFEKAEYAIRAVNQSTIKELLDEAEGLEDEGEDEEGVKYGF